MKGIPIFRLLSRLWIPMVVLAVVVIGGLVSATLLTLIVLPTLYVVFEGRGHDGPRLPQAGL